METVSDSQTPKLAKKAAIENDEKVQLCFGCTKETSHSDDSFEYPQHMFWMRNKDISFPIRTLIWRPTHLFEMPFTCLFSDIICWKSNAAIRQHLGAAELRAKLR